VAILSAPRNLITGRVRNDTRQVGPVAFDLPEGVALEAYAQHVPRGDETQVGRPDDAHRARRAGCGNRPNAVTGHVRRRLFQGDFIQYQVEWPAVS